MTAFLVSCTMPDFCRTLSAEAAVQSDVRLDIRIPKALRDAAKAKAEAEMLSLSAWLKRLIAREAEFRAPARKTAKKR